jgi:hypothetical protein
MPTHPESDANQGPLSPEQREELTRATERAGKILGAGKVASFNGWTLGVIGAISLLFGLFSLTGFIAGACLLVVAWNEFRGRDMLRSFEPQGPDLLWKNQVGLMSLVIAYCAWSIYKAKAYPSSEVAQLEELAGLPTDFITDMTVTVYGAAILLTLLFQGLNARYYFARVQMLAEYLRETPDWIVDLQKINAEGNR